MHHVDQTFLLAASVCSVADAFLQVAPAPAMYASRQLAHLHAFHLPFRSTNPKPYCQMTILQ
jgi:hypothetical protein